MRKKNIGLTVVFFAMTIASCGPTSPIRSVVVVENTGEALQGGVKRCFYMQAPDSPPLFGKDTRMKTSTEIETWAACPARIELDANTGEPYEYR